jgi:hypothetical protein
MLLDSEKVDVRRFCGFPAIGASAPGPALFGFSQSYLTLENRLASLSVAELVIIRRYLNSLTSLELAIPAASENLDTDEASMWSRNRKEVDDRLRLFDEWRRRLCGFLGIKVGPALSNSSFSLIV